MAATMGHGFEGWAGPRPIGELERLAYERHVADIKSCAERGLWFDDDAAQYVIDFYSRFAVFTKGEWTGKPFKLAPWQEFLTRCLFGWMRLPKGMSAREAARIPFHKRLEAGIRRRFDSAFIEIPRKNGKTEWAAAAANYLTMADGEPVAEVYSAATKQDQARIVFDAARRMIKFGKNGLDKALKPLRNSIVCERWDSSFQPLSAEYSSLDGLNIHGCIVDELHAHRNRELLEVLTTATGARRQPMIIMITTAGSDIAGIGYEEHDYGVRILRGAVQDDRRFVFIACADDAEAWQSEKELRKANPNWCVSVNPETVREEIRRATSTPARRRSVLRYHLNLWVNEKDAWMDFDSWRSCGEEIAIEDLRGRRCFAGLDLSKTTDLTAMALVFPPSSDDPKWRCVMRYWCPESAVRSRAGQESAPFLSWVDSGHIEQTAGNGVDYGEIEAALRDASERFDLVQVGFDPWNAHKFIADMEKESGFVEFIRVAQTTKDLNAPMKELERLVATREFAHNNNPVLDWNVFNCVVKATPDGNIKPDKAASRDLIDGVSALVIAMAVAQADMGESVYNVRGIMVV